MLSMKKEPKGFRNNYAQKLEREYPITTKAGIVIYKGRGDSWYLSFPYDTRRIGGVTTIKLMNLIYYLNKYNGNLDESRDKVGFS